MGSHFLITTAEEQTWRLSKPILFLGDWCKLYKKKESWKNLDSLTKNYHWDNRTQLFKDYRYLKKLYEKIILVCVDSLNEFHQVNYSVRYWKIFIGPWLYHFLQILFDRWAMIKSIENDEISGTIILTGLDSKVLPLNINECNKLYSSELWNHWIYGEIIRTIGTIPFEEVKYQPSRDLNPSINKLNKFKYFVKKIIGIYSFINKKNKYFFYGGPFNKFEQLKLQFYLNEAPSFYDFAVNEEVSLEITKRDTFKVDYKVENEFESFLIKMIPLQIPKYYLEGYNNLYKECKKKYWPNKPRCIITSSPIIWSDIFKFWVAEKVERGSKLIISQHGGHYGVGKWNASEDHEIDISDEFSSWGWREKGVKPLSSVKLSRNKYQVSSSSDDILIALGISHRYSYWLYSIPIASQWSDYLDDQVKFIELLPENIKKHAKLRVYSSDYNWSQKKRLSDKLPGVCFDDNENSFKSSVADARIFIGTYNATTFLETMSANTPTIIFWNPLHSEIRDSAKPYFDLLFKAGIMHYSPESAARYLARIWDNIDAWWSLKETQKARLTFVEQFAKSSDNCLSEWKVFLDNY